MSVWLYRVWVVLALGLGPPVHSQESAPLSLADLKKHDFAIRWRSGSRGGAGDRCFLHPEVNAALSRARSRVAMLPAHIRVLRCYEPAHPVFGTGVAVRLEAESEHAKADKELVRALRAEGFEAGKSKGEHVYSNLKAQPVQTIPVEALP